jgi:hypothetical protein
MKAELRHTVRSVVGTVILGAIAGTLCGAWGCERGAPDHEALANRASGEKVVLQLGVAASSGAGSAGEKAGAAPAGALPLPAATSAGAGGASSRDGDDTAGGGAKTDDDTSGAAAIGKTARSARDAAQAVATEASGSPSPSCVKGWITPARGSALRKAALDMIRSDAGERFGVVEMRYFVGPEDAEVLSPQSEIERWYVKAYSLTDPERRQRWLVRRAPVGRGVDAVAPFASRGYGPRTWKRVDATDESLADPFLRPCNRTKPGTKCMGLPREVLGCLAGT